MRTKISARNPYGPNRYGFLYEVLSALPEPSKCHLDYGSFDGSVPLELLSTRTVQSAVAADVVDIDERFRDRFGEKPELLELHQLAMAGAGDSLPSNRFTTASILDALEHIHDQDAVLRAIHRALRHDALFVVTVPQRHIFSFLDMGNWKFMFPTLHRWFITLRHSEQHYTERYGSPEAGLIGDIEVAKSWHEHFSVSSLTDLLERNGFRVQQVDGAGLFARPLGIMRHLLPFGLGRLLNGATELDARLFSSTHLFVVAVPIPPKDPERRNADSDPGSVTN